MNDITLKSVYLGDRMSCGTDITMLNQIGFFVEGCSIWRVHVVLVRSFHSEGRGGTDTKELYRHWCQENVLILFFFMIHIIKYIKI